MRNFLKNTFANIILSVILGIVYGKTIAPGLTWANNGADGGDLISAAFTGGVPHPGGYPLYLLLAGMAQYLPVGNIAFRTNLLSAGLTILAALVIYRTICQLTGRENSFSAGVSALALGLAPIVWGQAVITEVYSLFLLTSSMIIWMTFTPVLTRLSQHKQDVLRGVFFGLGLCSHLTTIFFLSFLAIENPGSTEKFSIRRTLQRFLWAILIFSLLYSTLMLRAAGHHPINWENPVSLSGLFSLMSGKIYQEYIFQGQDVYSKLILLIKELFNQMGLASALVVLGFVFTPGKRVFRYATIFIVLTCSFFSIFYNTPDSFIYMLPVTIFMAIYLGYGLTQISNSNLMKQQATVKYFFFMCVLIILAINTNRNWRSVDASTDTRAVQFAAEILGKTPQSALIITRSDQASLSLWYYQFVEHQRPDLAVIVIGLLDYDWYRQMLRDSYPGLIVPDDSQDERKAIEKANPLRPVCNVFTEPEPVFSCK